jgi:hypothetical protein
MGDGPRWENMLYCRECFGDVAFEDSLTRKPWAVSHGQLPEDCHCREDTPTYSGFEILSNPALLCEFLESRAKRGR